jgi:hypothetical protein
MILIFLNWICDQQTAVMRVIGDAAAGMLP